MAMPTQRDLDLVQPGRSQVFDGSIRLFTHFAQTPARDLLKFLPGGCSDAAVLFLGCADGSSLLTSLAARHPGLQNLTASLNDINPMMLARAAVLLLLAAELDPDSREDMQVLWDVWYNLVWGPSTLPRVKPFIERLLQDSVPWLKPLRPEDKDVLRRVFSWWLTSGKPTASKYLRLREEFRTKVLPAEVVESSRDHICDYAPQAFVKMDSLEAVEEALQHVAAPPGSSKLRHALQQDLQPWFETGCMTPNYTGQVAADTSRAANATVCSAIKSGSIVGLTARACIARITQLVRDFQAHTQLGPAAPAATGDAEQQSSGRVHVQVQLVCGDALQLCLGSTLTPAAARQPHSKQGKKGAASASHAVTQPPQLFDIIDTSTLADDNGLLPLLLAAGARLKPMPHARLCTSLSKWSDPDGTGKMASDTMRVYLSRALCMPLTLTPTLLGVRLLTDLTPDRPETSEAQECTYRVNHFRELLWAPIPTELQASPLPQLQPQLLGGQLDSIEEALQAVATQLCCITNIKSTATGRAGIENGTPQLLAWLLASLTQRTDMGALLGDTDHVSRTGSSHRSDGRKGSGSTGCGGGVDSTAVQAQYATIQRLLWALRRKVSEWLPAHFRLAFKTAVDVLRTSLQQNAPADWQPADVPLCQGVLQISGWLPRTAQETLGGAVKRVVMVESAQAAGKRTNTKAASRAEVDGWSLHAAKIPAGTHIIDLYGSYVHHVDAAPLVSVFIPTDHGSGRPHTGHMYMGGTDGTCQLQLSAGAPRTVQAPATLAQVLLPAACPATALRQPVAPAAAPSTQPWALQVVSLTETAIAYHAVVQLVGARAGTAAVSKPSLTQSLHVAACIAPHSCATVVTALKGSDAQQLCSTKHNVVISMPEPASQVQPVELLLRWPVAVTLGEPECAPGYSSGSTILSFRGPNKGQVVVEMLKAEAWEMWPNDVLRGVTPARLDLDQLAPYERGDEALEHRCWFSQYLESDLEKGVPKATEGNITRQFLHGMMQSAGPVWKLHPKSPQYYVITGHYYTSKGTWEETKLRLKLHKAVLLTAAGRPLIPATVVDGSMCEDAISNGLMKQDVLDQLLQQLEIGSEPDPHIVDTNDGCAEWRRMLLRKALACHPTAAQEAALPGGSHPPYYYSTYVSYMQHIGSGYDRCVPMLGRGDDHVPPGRGSYLSNRVNELVQEYLTHTSDDPGKDDLLQQLRQLIEWDTNNVIDPGSKVKAQMVLNWSSENIRNARQAPSPVFSKECEKLLASLCRGEPAVEHSRGGPLPRSLMESGSRVQSLLEQPGGIEEALRTGLLQEEEERPGAQTVSNNKTLQALMQELGLHAEAGSNRSSAKQGSSQQVGGSSGVITHRCAGCGKQEGRLLRCGGCKAVQYCSRECQVAHWEQHKVLCKKGSKQAGRQ